MDLWLSLAQRRSRLLLAGDALAFVVFSAVGHRDHGEATGFLAILGTAAPFVVAWALVAPLAGAFELRRAATPARLLGRTAFAWLCTWPVALLFRAVALHRGIPIGFAIVALIANALFLLLWRTAYLVSTRRAGRTARPA